MTASGAAPEIVALVGPTGTGKTAVSLALARLVGAEIVCGDSRQLFRGLDAGTGKPTAAERADVPHHLFDELDPAETPNAGWYARLAAPLLGKLRTRGVLPLVVGGSGLYLKALYHGLAPIPDISPEVRADVRARLASLGCDALHAELAADDPETAARLAPGDSQRVARALEVARGTGRPLSAWLRERRIAPYGGPERWRIVALHLSRPALYRRLDRRTRSFFEDGLLAETRTLLAQGTPRRSPGLASLGYAQATAFVLDGMPIEDAIAQAQQATRRYAKRQETWWRHEGPRAGVRWLSIADGEPPDEIACRVQALIA